MAVKKPSPPGRVVRPNWRAVRNTAWPPIALLAYAVTSWELAVRVFRVPTGLLPVPSRAVSTLVTRQEVFVDNLATTLSEIVMGFVFGFAAGIVVAILVVYSSPIRRALYPIVIVSQTIPIVALAPLLVIIMGFGIGSKVVIVALGVFFPLALNVIAGLRSADPNHVRMLRSFSASRLQIFRM